MTNLDKLCSVLTRPKVYIQMHNFPDPDAIASAYGLMQLLKYRGIEAVVCYKGKIERYNACYIMNKLEISFQNLLDIDGELQESDEVILVDAQKLNSNIIDMTGAEVACIDHHPTYIPVEYRFSDIRPQAGACASIIASYFFENEIPMDAKTALALTYGIRSDTDKLSRGVDILDMEMLYRMFPLCDKNLIFYLENSELAIKDLHAYSRAIESMRIYDYAAFADAGDDCPEALVACVSDFLLNLAEVSFSVIYTHRRDGLKFSVRSMGDLNAGDVAREALEGLGSGGGHPVMAGGFVPFTGNEHEKELLIHRIVERFLEVLEIVPRG